MAEAMLYQDIVKPAMDENNEKFKSIIADLMKQEKIEDQISKGVKKLESKRSEDKDA